MSPSPNPLDPAEPLVVGSLFLVPLHSLATAPCLAVSLVGEQTAVVKAVSESCTVGRLRLESQGPDPVLLIAGTLLRGATQDRTESGSQLALPGSNIDLAVACAQQGCGAFRGGTRVQKAWISAPWTLRSSGLLQASRSEQPLGHHDADPGAERSAIRHPLRHLDVQRRTGMLWVPLAEG